MSESFVTLEQSYEHCRQLNKKSGTTYYWSTTVLPKVKRHHVHALYGFCRYADDIVDDLGDVATDVRAKALADFGERFFEDLEAGDSNDLVIKATVHTVRAFQIDPDCVRRFLRSMTMDLTVETYETYDDLLHYMDGSAAVIGEMMLPILEPTDPAAFAPARELGNAFQLTNFLRDIDEDLDRSRIYVPQEDIRRFGAQSAFETRTATPEFRELMRFEIARTRELSQAASRARRLGAYVVERKIGEGGMGVVFAATHAMLRRTAAVKLVSRATPTTLARFEREVRAASKLRHPNAVQIWDYGRTREGVFYYAMEYVDGLDLESVVRSEGPLHPGRAVAILAQVAGALREAHEAHLVHRDIKPANIMIAVIGGVPDFAKVLDFGLAKDLDDDEGPRTIVTEGKVVGTPLFVAPEQIDSPSDVDGRADLWSLGAVAYFLLSGHPPYEGANVGALVQARLDGPPVLPSVRRGSKLPESLETLVMELLSRDPARRPADADALIRRLEALEGVERWRSADAQRWWRERGAALRAAARTKHQEFDKTAGARIAVE